MTDLGQEYEAVRAELDPVLERILSSGFYILGEETESFERDLAAYCDVRHAIGVNSGTDAIALALRALRIGAGDEVLVPAMSFIATVEPVLLLGARPVFVDIDPVTYTMDPAAARSRISPKTKAILAVHLYGHPADLFTLSEISKAAGVALVEDMAQAIGSRWRSRQAGSWGALAALSFFPTKNLGACGDGGAVLTSSEELAGRVRMLRNHGAKIKYQHEEVGTNSRLDEIQSAILRVKLRHLDAWNERRRRLAAEYADLLKGLPITLPSESADACHVYHLYSIQSDRRDGLRAFLQERRISTGLHYPKPLHLQNALRGLGGKRGDFPVSERLAEQTLSLPLYPFMTSDDLKAVASAVRDFFR